MSESDPNLASGEGVSEPVESAGPRGVVEKIKNHRLAQTMQGDGLRAKALRGSGWTIAGFGASQVLRLGSNLILTRLLFPEAFGLMALAQVFLQGLSMLSDIGVGPSIVQNKRGDDPDFLATAWTMQVIRGFALSFGMFALAYPASLVYDEPLLFPILMLIGLTAVIQGFQSIGMATASRKMALGRLTMIDLVSQSVGIGTMVVWAWYFPTVWALVGGGVLASIVRVILGHRVLRSPGNRLYFERSAAREIFHFGKWIFLATATTYFGGQGLRLVEGALVPMDVLGMISIAGMLAWAAGQFTGKIGGAVLFPAFASIHNERPGELAKKFREARIKLFLMTCPVFLVLILLGRDLIHLMYDERYQEAGVYLVILATGSAVTAQRTPFGMVLLATGDSAGPAMIQTVAMISRISALLLGFAYGGVIGMLIAVSAAQVFVYPFEAWRLQAKGLWSPFFDSAVFFVFAVALFLSYISGPFII